MNDDERIWYELGIIIGKKEYKDKIKAKIEELEKLDLVSQFTANLTTITILQSLLEKRSNK